MRVAKKLPFNRKSNALLGRKQVVLYVDEEFESELNKFLKDDKLLEKFFMAADFILTGGYKNDLYGHEESSDDSKDIYAIKIYTKGNHRIYCKEFKEDDIKRVVLIEYVDKKTQKNNKTIRKLINRIGRYEYDEFQD